jgi:hypothetical protein
MKRVLITAVFEDGAYRDSRVGEVTQNEFAQLKALVGSTIRDRIHSVDAYPVLRRVYNYRKEEDEESYYEYQDEITDSFAKVEPGDVADLLCHHIMWEACD